MLNVVGIVPFVFLSEEFQHTQEAEEKDQKQPENEAELKKRVGCCEKDATTMYLDGEVQENPENSKNVTTDRNIAVILETKRL